MLQAQRSIPQRPRLAAQPKLLNQRRNTDSAESDFSSEEAKRRGPENRKASPRRLPGVDEGDRLRPRLRPKLRRSGARIANLIN